MKRENGHSDFKIRSSISCYLKEIDSYPLLSQEEEVSLAKTYQECCQKKVQQGSEVSLCRTCAEAKRKLIVSNLRFVVSIAKKYQGCNLSIADLINEGNLGLIQSVDKFDYKRGFHFISYAVWWIRQSILKAVSEKSRMIRLPMNRTNELLHIRHYQDDFQKEFGRIPKVEEVSKHLDIPSATVSKILECASSHGVLEEMGGEDNDNENSCARFHNSPEEKASHSALQECLLTIVRSLPQRESYIISKRYGLDEKNCQSLTQIGIALNLTKERVRQLEKKALIQLKDLAEQKEIPLFL